MELLQGVTLVVAALGVLLFFSTFDLTLVGGIIVGCNCGMVVFVPVKTVDVG